MTLQVNKWINRYTQYQSDSVTIPYMDALGMVMEKVGLDITSDQMGYYWATGSSGYRDR